jgi:hypothetical protein
MQTTIQLDDALLAQATKLAREKGCDLSHLIEETLRDKIAPSLPQALKPFTTEESHRCFAISDPAFDALAAHCAALPVPLPEE